MKQPAWERLPLLACAFAALFAGMAAGLWRLGWSASDSLAALSMSHGPLMVSGFLGTVISVERAVALNASGKDRWAWFGPVFSGAAGLALILGAPAQIAVVAFVLASSILTAASFLIYSRQRELFTLTLALGAACWLNGNLLWLAGLPVSDTVTWSAAFLVLTIAGERLELSRVLPPSAMARRVFAALVAALLAGCTLAIADRHAGTLLLGAVLLGLSIWFLRQDIARRTVKASGLTRFIAVCLLAGYAWLAIAGLIMIVGGGLGRAGPAYDAALHAVFLGFAFSMIFGHAPIIFPAVLRVAVPYSTAFYAPLVLLHGSLTVRLAGDWMLSSALRAWGGALNGLAILAFVIGTVTAVVRGRMTAHNRQTQRKQP
jgi:hypothetical protein